MAIARFVFRNKEHLAAIRTSDGVLTLTTMRFADEVVPPSELEEVLPDEAPKVAKREQEMAEQLIDSLSTDFDPAAYRDEYREELLATDRTQGRRQGDRRRAGERGAEGDQGSRPDGGARGEHRRGQGQEAHGEETRETDAPRRAKRRRNRNAPPRARNRSPRSRPWPRASRSRSTGRELKLTNLDKVLYPKAGFTKGEVVDYYAKVAPAMVPHLSGRAVTLRRFPEGVDDLDAAFFEKRCPKHRPKWVKTTRVEAGPHAGKIDFCVCDGLPTLIWMAQLAAIELHPSLSLARAPKRPDRARLRPRPRPAGRRRRLLPGGAAAARAVRPLRRRVLPQDLGLEGPAGLRPAQHAEPATRRRNRSPKRSPSCSRSRPPTRSSRR